MRTRSFAVIVSVNHKAITVFAVGWKRHLILLSVLGHANLLFILKKRALWFREGGLVVIQRLLVCTFHWLVSGHCSDESHKWSVAGAMLQALLSHLMSLLAAVHSNVQKNIKIDKSYPRPTHRQTCMPLICWQTSPFYSSINSKLYNPALINNKRAGRKHELPWHAIHSLCFIWCEPSLCDN